MSTAPAPAGRPRREKREFLRQFIAHPGSVGAVAPSSRHLAERMLRGVRFDSARTIVEFGPGTGAITGAILERLSLGTRFFAIEINPEMVRLLRERHPGLRVHEDSVENAEAICRAEGVESVDYIISGLPWTAFPDDLQERALGAAARVLRPGGQLVTFGYRVGTWMPRGRRFHARLPEYFRRVERSGYVWRNVPPAFVLRCTK